MEENRLGAYMKEKGEAWIAAKLGRFESPVRQHSDIMCRRSKSAQTLRAAGHIVRRTDRNN